MNAKFIYCLDKSLAEKLKNYYKLISESSGVYIFDNNPINSHFDFSNIDKTKISFTNALFL